MDFLFYFLVLFLSLIATIFLTICFTTINVGLSYCFQLLKDPLTKDYDTTCIKSLKKKYYISLVVDFTIFVVISSICILFLKKYLITYLISLLVLTLISYRKTKKTEINNSDFLNSLRNQQNFSTVFISILDKGYVINEFSVISSLPLNLCEIIFRILLLFQYDEKEKALTCIHTILIPSLKQLNDITKVGIAFGMLIDDVALSKNEANKMSEKVIIDILGNE